MSLEILFLLLLLGAATFLFISNYVTYDVTAVIIMASLLLSGILTPEEGLSGFSNPATVTVAAMFILSEGVRRTGILNQAGNFFSDRMEVSFNGWFLALLIFIGIISAFINNTAAVAIFIPVVMSISSNIGVSPSKMLIPLSFAGMFGGVCTLIGTSTNILVSSIAEERGLDPIGMFELTPMGIIFFITGLAFLFLVGIRMIPERRHEEDLTRGFELQEYLTDIVIKENSVLVGKTLDEKQLTRHLDLDVLRVFKDGSDSSAQRSKVSISAGDVLRIRGSSDQIKELLQRNDLTIKPAREWMDPDLEHGRDAVVETVVAPDSDLDGSRLKDSRFYERLGAVPLAIRHKSKILHNDLDEVKLSGGDTLLLSVSSDRLGDIENDPRLLVVSEPDILTYRKQKTPIVLAILAGVVVSASLGITSIVVSAIVGIIAMILTGCLKPSEAYESVNWKVVILLAGVLPLGTAMDKTGTATLMADLMIAGLSDFGPTVLMSGYFLLTLLITGVMSNNASAALLAPIAIQSADSLGVAHEPFLYAVTFAASLSLITPFGYQTNTMIYGPGQYKLKDFLKVGTLLNLLFWILATLLIPVIWPF